MNYPTTVTVLNISKGGIPEDVVLTKADDNYIEEFTNEATPQPTHNINVGDQIVGY